MIHPHVEIVDLDPGLTGRIHEAVAAGQGRRRWVFGLHRRGEAVAAVRGHRAQFARHLQGETLESWAARLLKQTQRPRVVLIDEDGLPELVRKAASHARPELTLFELDAAVWREYWASPSVTTAPPPPRDPWSDLH